MLATIFIVLLLALILLPQWWVKHVMNKYARQIECLPGSGSEFAQHIMQQYQLPIHIESTGKGDHYDPFSKTVRLNNSNYQGKSLTAIAIAAHEIGHAIQHHRQDRRLKWRTRLVGLSQRIERIAMSAMMLSPLIGLAFQSHQATLFIIIISYLGFINTFIIQLITLPIEWDASFSKAMPILESTRLFPKKDLMAMKIILTAAALTYLAGALASLLNFLRWFRR